MGGLTKVAIQWEVGAGRNMTCTEEILSLLKAKFSEKSNPLYILKDIWLGDLDEEGKIERFKRYSFSEGSSKFQVTAWTTQEN